MRLIAADKIESHEQLEPYGNGKYEYVRVAYMDDIDNLPPVTTLYGYNIESLVSVAEIMKREGISPEEALYIFKNNVQKIVEIVRAEIQESIIRHFEEAYFKGEQNDTTESQ